ncbi:hypothetical protein V8C40DRAFT_263902 [Trichoderma camerunense]
MATEHPPDEAAYSLQTPEPGWAFGSSPNHTHARASTSAATVKHIATDPFAPNCNIPDNYMFLVSGVAPQPITFI